MYVSVSVWAFVYTVLKIRIFVCSSSFIACLGFRRCSLSVSAVSLSSCSVHRSSAMASSPYFLSEASPRRPASNGPRSAQIRSGPPPPSPSLHHRNASVSPSETPFPGFQTPARDAGLRPVENSAFSARPERSPSFGRTADYGYGEGGGGGYGGGGAGGTGGKLRSAKKQTKKTPYERPPTGRHATAGGSASIASASSGGSSIASKIRDSASRLITSSASYLFASLFKRRPLALRSKGDSQQGAEIFSSSLYCFLYFLWNLSEHSPDAEKSESLGTCQKYRVPTVWLLD